MTLYLGGERDIEQGSLSASDVDTKNKCDYSAETRVRASTSYGENQQRLHRLQLVLPKSQQRLLQKNKVHHPQQRKSKRRKSKKKTKRKFQTNNKKRKRTTRQRRPRKMRNRRKKNQRIKRVALNTTRTTRILRHHLP